MTYSDAVPVGNPAKLNCFIRRLKALNRLPSYYVEFKVTEPIENCDRFVKDARGEVYRIVAFKQLGKPDFGEHNKCVEDDERSQSWVDDMWLEHIYEASRTLPEVHKRRRVAEMEAKMLTSAKEVYKTCVYRQDFANFFNAILASDSRNHVDTHEEQIQKYCARKLVVADSILNPWTYRVEMNPKNLVVKNVTCETVLQPVFTNLRNSIVEKFKNEDFTEKQIQCVGKKFRENRYVGRLLAVGVLSELKITEMQKEKERTKFVNFMVDMVNTLENCTD